MQKSEHICPLLYILNWSNHTTEDNILELAIRRENILRTRYACLLVILYYKENNHVSVHQNNDQLKIISYIIAKYIFSALLRVPTGCWCGHHQELATSLTLYGPVILSICKYHLLGGDEQRLESEGNKNLLTL